MFCIIGDDFNATLIIELDKDGDKKYLKDNTKAMAALGVYDFVGLYKKFPVYRIREKGEYSITYIIKEWEGGAENGFRGWIGTVLIFIIKLYIINIFESGMFLTEYHYVVFYLNYSVILKPKIVESNMLG